MVVGTRPGSFSRLRGRPVARARIDQHPLAVQLLEVGVKTADRAFSSTTSLLLVRPMVTRCLKAFCLFFSTTHAIGSRLPITRHRQPRLGLEAVLGCLLVVGRLGLLSRLYSSTGRPLRRDWTFKGSSVKRLNQ